VLLFIRQRLDANYSILAVRFRVKLTDRFSTPLGLFVLPDAQGLRSDCWKTQLRFHHWQCGGVPKKWVPVMRPFKGEMGAWSPKGCPAGAASLFLAVNAGQNSQIVIRVTDHQLNATLQFEVGHCPRCSNRVSSTQMWLVPRRSPSCEPRIEACLFGGSNLERRASVSCSRQIKDCTIS
jgi:hypothetical protein